MKGKLSEWDVRDTTEHPIKKLYEMKEEEDEDFNDMLDDIFGEGKETDDQKDIFKRAVEQLGEEAAAAEDLKAGEKAAEKVKIRKMEIIFSAGKDAAFKLLDEVYPDYYPGRTEAEGKNINVLCGLGLGGSREGTLGCFVQLHTPWLPHIVKGYINFNLDTMEEKELIENTSLLWQYAGLQFLISYVYQRKDRCDIDIVPQFNAGAPENVDDLIVTMTKWINDTPNPKKKTDVGRHYENLQTIQNESSDGGSRRRKRKSTKRKSTKRKSTKRKSTKRKSTKRKSTKKKNKRRSRR